MKKNIFLFLVWAVSFSLVLELIPLSVSAISQTNSAATIVIGQSDMESDDWPDPAANTFFQPENVFSDGTHLFISDTYNNRVLIYNTIPTEDGASADVVIGQVDMTSDDYLDPADNTLNNPLGVFFDGTKLYIADAGNNRVLIYNTIPTEDGASADVVIGQADFNSGAVNQGGSVDDNTLKYPTTVYATSSKLFIADQENNRVLIYNTIPTEDGASADVVIGQANMTSNSANQSGSVDADTLYYPKSVYSDGTRLFIADERNNRILIYNTIPTEDGASANVVIGQANMTSDSANQSGSVAANTLYRPQGIYSDGTRLFVADYINHRVLVYNSVPDENNTEADIVIGQEDLESNDYLSPAANTLNYPTALYPGHNQLFVVDSGFNRVLIYPLGPTNTSLGITEAENQSQTITLNLTASSDTKEFIISENEDLSGADWQTYSAHPTYTFSGAVGWRTLYVKFRDWGNYESGLYSLDVEYNPSGDSDPEDEPVIVAEPEPNRATGGGLPIYTTPPQPPIGVQINNGQSNTISRQVKLSLEAGIDAKRFAVSEDPNFPYASLLDYQPEIDYTLSAGNGLKTVYVKFYTQYGYASKPVSASIVLGLTVNSASAPWTPPNGYEYITSPSQLNNYTNILKDRNSQKLYGLPKKSLASVTQFNNDLYYGLTNDSEVKRLQEFLIAQGYLDSDLNTGNYYGQTQNAVKKFQQANKIIPANGRFGPKTRAVLNGMR